MPWQGGHCLTWDATIIDTSAVSYIQIGSTVSASAANAAAARKHIKYDTALATHIFVPVAVETLGPFCDEGLKFVSEIGLSLSTISADLQETNFLFLRISVLIQRFNKVVFMGPFKIYQTLFLTFLWTLGVQDTKGTQKKIIIIVLLVYFATL